MPNANVVSKEKYEQAFKKCYDYFCSKCYETSNNWEYSVETFQRFNTRLINVLNKDTKVLIFRNLIKICYQLPEENFEPSLIDISMIGYHNYEPNITGQMTFIRIEKNISTNYIKPIDLKVVTLNKIPVY